MLDDYQDQQKVMGKVYTAVDSIDFSDIQWGIDNLMEDYIHKDEAFLQGHKDADGVYTVHFTIVSPYYQYSWLGVIEAIKSIQDICQYNAQHKSDWVIPCLNYKKRRLLQQYREATNKACHCFSVETMPLCSLMDSNLNLSDLAFAGLTTTEFTLNIERMPAGYLVPEGIDVVLPRILDFKQIKVDQDPALVDLSILNDDCTLRCTSFIWKDVLDLILQQVQLFRGIIFKALKQDRGLPSCFQGDTQQRKEVFVHLYNHFPPVVTLAIFKVVKLMVCVDHFACIMGSNNFADEMPFASVSLSSSFFWEASDNLALAFNKAQYSMVLFLTQLFAKNNEVLPAIFRVGDMYRKCYEESGFYTCVKVELVAFGDHNVESESNLVINDVSLLYSIECVSEEDAQKKAAEHHAHCSHTSEQKDIILSDMIGITLGF